MIYFNGSFVPEEEARVSIFDRGFLYGDGLFETMRAYRGKVFRLDLHLQRLFHSAKIISLSIPKTLKELEEAVYGTLKANNLKDAYLRLTVSRGEGERGLDLPLSPRPNIIIVAKPLSPYPKRWYEEGLRAVVVRVRREK
ncbi:aminotransferase class IV, partial [bacterium]|nr:aminotransferase class IV [bacterium]